MTMPSEGRSRPTIFDRFAGKTGEFVSRAPFFAFCCVLIVAWAPTFFLLPLDTWQLIINTITTIITFLLIALLQNTSRRSDDAVQQKLNAIAQALAVTMDDMDNEDEAEELRHAIGLEKHEAT
jgi:low affinity Fe/Cu permease